MCHFNKYVCAEVSPVETVLCPQTNGYPCPEAAARLRVSKVIYESRRSFYNAASGSAIKTGSKGHDAQAAARLGDETGGLGQDAK